MTNILNSKEGTIANATEKEASKITPGTNYKEDIHLPSDYKIQNKKDDQMEFFNITSRIESKDIV